MNERQEKMTFLTHMIGPAVRGLFSDASAFVFIVIDDQRDADGEGDVHMMASSSMPREEAAGVMAALVDEYMQHGVEPEKPEIADRREFN